MVNMQWGDGYQALLAAHEEHPEVVLESLRPFLQKHLGK